MFDENVVFEIPGDIGALPWIGRMTGRAAVENFLTHAGNLLKRERFEVLDILASATRAAILGELASRVVASGRLIEMSFAIVLSVNNSKISRFLMLEDSFAVSAATRT
jgi:ketosteroid isomerase-like protein